MGWAAIDHLPVDISLTTPFQTTRNVPAALRENWRGLVLDVLQAWHDAKDDAEVNRMLKWFTILPKLFLRVAPRGGRRGHGVIGTRFEWYRTDKFDLLFKSFERDSAGFTHAPDRQPDATAAYKRGTTLLAQNLRSKAKSAFLSTGLAPLHEEPFLGQMRAKHPPLATEIASDLSQFGAAGTTQVKVQGLMHTLADLDLELGGAPNGLLNEHLKLLAAPNTLSGPRLSTLIDELATAHAAANLPDWWYKVRGAYHLVGPYKNVEKTQARPVAVGDVWKRAVAQHRAKQVADRAGVELSPTQLSVGVKEGVGIAVTVVREHMALDCNRAHHCVHVDVSNAHNSFDRQLALEAISTSTDPEIASFVQQLWAENRSETQAYYHGRPLDGVTSKTGGQQGDPLLNMEFAYLLMEPQRRLRAALATGSADDGEVKFIADDGYAMAPPVKLYPALAQFKADLAALGLECNVSKYETYITDPQYDSPLRPQEMKLSGVTAADGSWHAGVTVGGCPVGSDEYVTTHLATRFDEIVSEANKLQSALQLVNPMALWCLTSSCTQQQLYHWLRYNYPKHTVPALARVQAAIDQSVNAAWGSSEAFDDPLVLERVRLAVRNGGAGLRALADVAPAAFVGATFHIAHRLVDRTESGMVCPGLAPGLVKLFGIGAFDESANGQGRFSGLCSGSSVWGDEFKTAYIAMRNELSPAERLDGPLEAEVHNSGYGFSAKAQHRITEAREAPRLKSLQAKMQALPNTDVRKISFFSIVGSKTACMLLVAHPCPTDFSFRPDEWGELMARYWGLKSPMLKNYVGERINGQASRVCDPYGFELQGKALPGPAFVRRHDHIKWAVVNALEAMGVDVTCEPQNLFKRFVSAAAADHLASQAGRQGTVPDFLLRVGGTSALFDLKTIGLNKSRYLNPQPAHADTPAGYAVERRAQQVPAGYIHKARVVDVKYNGTAPGQVGPMEAALASYGGVSPLVAGHFNEISRGFDKLLGDAAELGAQQLQNALYTKSATQARAVLLWQLRRKMAAAICRANINCLQDLMAHLGTSGANARSHARKANARRYFFPRGDPANTGYQHRATHSNFPRDGGGGVHY